MSNFDIIARLQLSADQFSSETGKRFAEMKARAASAADEMDSSRQMGVCTRRASSACRWPCRA